MLKKINLFFVLLCCFQAIFAQNEPEQDCINAIPICFDTYGEVNSYSGGGPKPNEIDPIKSCLGSGELNAVWYTFTVQNDGKLLFLITPVDLTDDYDWAVYNLTNAECKDIFGNGSLEVSCNYSAIPGPTGCKDSSGLTDNQGRGGIPFNAVVEVFKNEIYVIVVSNYSGSGSGYTIDFTSSDASIFDVQPPSIVKIDSPVVCGSNKLTMHFSENILCSSIDITDFKISGGSVPYAVTAVQVPACTSSTYTRKAVLTISPPYYGGETLTLDLAGEILDVCSNIGTNQKIPFSTPAAFTISTDPNTVCDGTPVVLKATVVGTTNPYTYSFTGDGGLSILNASSNQHTFTYPGPGTYYYTVTVKDKNGCSIIHLDSATVHALPVLTVVTPANTCAGKPTQLNASVMGPPGVYTYSFTGAGGLNILNDTYGQQTFTFPGPGIYPYTVTVMDPNGCFSSLNDTAVVMDGLVFSATALPVCEGTPTPFAVIAPGTGTYTYTFTGDGGLDIQQDASGIQVYTFPSAGLYSYTVTVQDQNGCTGSYSGQTLVNPLPEADFSYSKLSDLSFNFQVSSPGATTYHWTFGDGTNGSAEQVAHTFPSAGTYQVTLVVTTGDGCSDTISKDLVTTVTPQPNTEYYLYVPNAFSPDNNGENETFNLRHAGIIRFDMSIFDRWGSMVFKSSHPETSWDGKAGNEQFLPAGVYIYKIKAEFGDGTEATRTGTVSVSR